ncbi:MAG: Sec-independent protein translocase protein TatB [Syntrophomonadaceae bacterium]
MLGFIGNIGPWELVLILLIALIVVGPGKLPEVARSIGKATSEFKKATTSIKREIQESIKLEDEVSSIKNELEKAVDINPNKPKTDSD